MSSLDFELDSRIDDLDLEWRQAQEACVVARAEYRALTADSRSNAEAIVFARELCDAPLDLGVSYSSLLNCPRGMGEMPPPGDAALGVKRYKSFQRVIYLFLGGGASRRLHFD